MGKRVSYEEASKVAKANVESRMPSRGEPGNRMEPECWAALRPSFRFDRSTGIFVIGSCFATNVERYLGDRGYTMLSAATGTTLSSGALNKYTPASVREAVAWARAIYDRDDKMTAEDAEACFMRLKDGRVIDTQLHAAEPVDEAAAIAKRGEVYGIYRRLFSAELVIITLGLIEAWFDSVTERSIVETPTRWMIREKGRFQFERLDYDQCLALMRETLALIRGDRDAQEGPQFLLTTSPVVLSRTFTQDDVIVANMYSKSVLRAVAGRLVEDDPRIDYFPSYESVMLTRNPVVWRDDLIHVSEPFIRQIMTRVERTYTDNVDDAYAEEVDLIGRFVNQVGSHDYTQAAELYRTLADPYSIASVEFHNLAAVLMMKLDDPARARMHLEQPMVDGAAETILSTHTPLRLWVWRWLDDLETGTAPGWQDALNRLKGANHLVFSRLWRSARWLKAEGETAAAADLLELVTPGVIDREPVLRQMLRMLDSEGRHEAAASLRKAWIAKRPEDSRLGDHVQVATASARAVLGGGARPKAEPDAVASSDGSAGQTPAETRPLTADLVVRRGISLIEKGEPERARRVAQRFMAETGRSNEALFAAAVLEDALGDSNAAASLREEAQRQSQAQDRTGATAAAQ